MIKTRIFFICMAFSLALFSCAGGAGGSGGGAEGTSLAIRTDNGAKTLYEKDDIVSFSVTISSGSYTASKTANKGETMLFSDIPAGTYSVKAYGKTASGSVAAKAETSVTIKSGETTNTVIRLSRIEHYTVTFHYGSAHDQQITKEFSAGYPAAKPTGSFGETGYTFRFWGISSEATSEYDWNAPIVSELDLYAVYNVTTYTVTFNFNGGHIGGTSSGDATSTVDVVEGHSPTTVPSAGEAAGCFSRPGYDFEGWVADSPTGTDATPSSDIITAAKTYYAKWTAIEYNITYTMPSGLSVTVGSGFDTYTTAAAKTLPVASDMTIPTGVTFAGWYANSSFTGTRIYSLSAGNTEDKTYYGKFTVKVSMYKEKFESGWGDDLGYVETNYGTPATAPSPLPTKTGYILSGWQTGPDGEETGFTFGSTAVTQTMTVWGVWTPGSVSTFSGTVAEFSAFAFTINGPGTVTNPCPVTITNATDSSDFNTIVTKLDSCALGSSPVVYCTLDFSSCNFTVLPNHAFGCDSSIGCRGIMGVTLPNTLTTIEYGAFYDANMTSIVLPSSLQSIGAHAFRYANLTSVNIPDSVTEISVSAFQECNHLTTFSASGTWSVYDTSGNCIDTGITLDVARMKDPSGYDTYFTYRRE